ncbi:hypothetical protein [Brevundimonas sp. G8]|uniref:hypothetical protein n=1 Tax=Brevundimonas sp. G8 TaxID=1350776 RepID=UPI0012F1DCC0|nr:hypothetical protein [Brevundimonas sp. G8]VXB29046.1 hypothetical protein BREVUG8_110145 [Brevundimonas sp. G8]
MKKIIAYSGLTFVYVFILLMLAEGVTLPWPHLLTVALCGAVGASLANLTRWLIERNTRRTPTL